MRLAFLNACETALTTETSPFANVAGALVKLGVPAVVASQYSISDKAAISFASKFYQALAEFHSLETAVAEGRKAVMFATDLNAMDWGVAALFMRTQDGVLFHRRH